MHQDKKQRACTIPAVFGLREWFEHRFGDLCDAHDAAYVNRTGKWRADTTFLKGMAKRGHGLLAIPTAFFFLTLGTWYYYTGPKPEDKLDAKETKHEK